MGSISYDGFRRSSVDVAADCRTEVAECRDVVMHPLDDETKATVGTALKSAKRETIKRVHILRKEVV
jgi:hypothetical protein